MRTERRGVGVVEGLGVGERRVEWRGVERRRVESGEEETGRGVMRRE